MATAASQGGCKLVSFPPNSDLSVAPALTRLGSDRLFVKEECLDHSVPASPDAMCGSLTEDFKENAWADPAIFLIPGTARVVYMF